MNEMDYWRLADTFTVIHAAALIANIAPSLVVVRDESDGGPYCQADASYGLDDADYDNKNFQAVFQALRGAIKSLKLKADIRCNGLQNQMRLVEGGQLESHWEPLEAINFEATLIDRDDLVTWLKTRKFRCDFFTTDAEVAVPGYRDKQGPFYAPKLAAALDAWRAVSSDSKYADNGKSVKHNLEVWLTAHAAQYDLVKENGEINSDAITNQVAKVANWQTGGGAPKTPGG